MARSRGIVKVAAPQQTRKLELLAEATSELKSVSKKDVADTESQGSITKQPAVGPIKPAPMAALALDLTQAITKAAESQVLKALTNLLSQVAEDYELDFEELQAKYLGEKKARKPRKNAVKAKVTKVEVTSEDDSETEAKDKPQCIAITKKGERCKCKPRNGETTCGRHKDYDPDAPVEVKEKKKPGRPRKVKKEESSDSEEEVKPKRKRATKAKGKAPEHKHDLEQEAEDCECCEEQGGPFQLRNGKSYRAPDEDEIRRRLAALDESDEEGEVQEEGEIQEEEFEVEVDDE
jgi:hypothetical protein